MRHHVGATLKVIASLVILWGIGAAIVTLSPAGEVPQARAVVTDLVPRHLIAEHAFGQMLLDRGMEPRAFDFNGNTMYFATQQVQGTPREVAAGFQRDMVQRGINKKAHDLNLDKAVLDRITPQFAANLSAKLQGQGGDSDFMKDGEGQALNIAQLQGDVVPVQQVGDEYVVMAGIVPKDKSPLTDEQAIKKWTGSLIDKEDPVSRHAEGLRMIDIMADGPDSSLVTATWADKSFDFKKIKPGYDGPGASPDPDVPACIGCTRLFRLSGLSEDEMTTNQFITSSSQEETEAFYLQALTSRGWTPAKAQRALSTLDPEIVGEELTLGKRILVMEQDGLTLTVVMEQDEESGETLVTTTKEHRGIPEMDFGNGEQKKLFKQEGLLGRALQ